MHRQKREPTKPFHQGQVKSFSPLPGKGCLTICYEIQQCADKASDASHRIATLVADRGGFRTTHLSAHACLAVRLLSIFSWTSVHKNLVRVRHQPETRENGRPHGALCARSLYVVLAVQRDLAARCMTQKRGGAMHSHIWSTAPVRVRSLYSRYMLCVPERES